MLPASSMSIVVPVSSVKARITAPPLPITSRIFSGLIFILIMRGANSDTSRACIRHGLFHQAKDVHAAFRGLGQRSLHDVAGDTVDLDVHLQRGYACFSAGHLEIHVAQVIFVAENVGQHRETIAVLDQAHCNARDVRLERHARHPAATRQPPHTEAIELEPLDSVISETTRIE